MTEKSKKNRSSISLSEATRKELARLKIHPREAYEDLVKRIISKEVAAK